jgi:hypothetical protein
MWATEDTWKPGANSSVRAQLFRYAGILKPFLSRRPPDLRGGGSLTETFALGQTALALKRLGKEDMRDFLRVILMNVADLLDEQLTDDRLKGLLAFDAVLGCHLGPRSPTSLLGLYYRPPLGPARCCARTPSCTGSASPMAAQPASCSMTARKSRRRSSSRPPIPSRPSWIWRARANSTPASCAR